MVNRILNQYNDIAFMRILSAISFFFLLQIFTYQVLQIKPKEMFPLTYCESAINIFIAYILIIVDSIYSYLFNVKLPGCLNRKFLLLYSYEIVKPSENIAPP